MTNYPMRSNHRNNNQLAKAYSRVYYSLIEFEFEPDEARSIAAFGLTYVVDDFDEIVTCIVAKGVSKKFARLLLRFGSLRFPQDIRISEHGNKQLALTDELKQQRAERRRRERDELAALEVPRRLSPLVSSVEEEQQPLHLETLTALRVDAPELENALRNANLLHILDHLEVGDGLEPLDRRCVEHVLSELGLSRSARKLIARVGLVQVDEQYRIRVEAI